MYRNETAQGFACTETEQQNKGQKTFKKPETLINTRVPDFSMVKSAVPKLYKGRPVSVHLLYYIAIPVGWMEHTTRRPTLSTRGFTENQQHGHHQKDKEQQPEKASISKGLILIAALNHTTRDNTLSWG